jgi:hypothetical protein
MNILELFNSVKDTTLSRGKKISFLNNIFFPHNLLKIHHLKMLAM